MSGIKHAGEVELQKLVLISSSGTAIDLTELVININIYESVFSHAMSGSILIGDTNNLSVNLPIIGQEYLSLKLNTPTLEDKAIDYSENVFVVYKIKQRESDSLMQVLELQFTTPEMLKSNRVRVSKSYTDTIDNIVTNILRDEKYINTLKKLHIEPTAGIRKLVSPNLHPFNFITNLATEAVALKDNNPFFMFYESTQGINFRSIESLFAEDTFGDYAIGDFGQNEGKKQDIGKDYGRIIDFEVSSNSDMLSNIVSGMLGSSIIEYNIYNKSYEKNTYNYMEDFSKFPRVNYEDSSKDNPIYSSGYIDSRNNTIGNFTDARIHLHPVNSSGAFDSQHNDPVNSYSYAPNKIRDSLLHRQAKFNEFTDGINVNMVINGSTNICVGKTINVTIPITGTTHDKEFDKYYTGKFLITKLKHSFDQITKRHEIALTASKDSFFESLPDEFGGPAIPDGTKQETNTINY